MAGNPPLGFSGSNAGILTPADQAQRNIRELLQRQQQVAQSRTVYPVNPLFQPVLTSPRPQQSPNLITNQHAFGMAGVSGLGIGREAGIGRGTPVEAGIGRGAPVGRGGGHISRIDTSTRGSFVFQASAPPQNHPFAIQPLMNISQTPPQPGQPMFTPQRGGGRTWMNYSPAAAPTSLMAQPLIPQKTNTAVRGAHGPMQGRTQEKQPAFRPGAPVAKSGPSFTTMRAGHTPPAGGGHPRTPVAEKRSAQESPQERSATVERPHQKEMQVQAARQQDATEMMEGNYRIGIDGYPMISFAGRTTKSAGDGKVIGIFKRPNARDSESPDSRTNVTMNMKEYKRLLNIAEAYETVEAAKAAKSATTSAATQTSSPIGIAAKTPPVPPANYPASPPYCIPYWSPPPRGRTPWGRSRSPAVGMHRGRRTPTPDSYRSPGRRTPSPVQAAPIQSIHRRGCSSPTTKNTRTSLDEASRRMQALFARRTSDRLQEKVSKPSKSAVREDRAKSSRAFNQKRGYKKPWKPYSPRVSGDTASTAESSSDSPPPGINRKNPSKIVRKLATMTARRDPTARRSASPAYPGRSPSPGPSRRREPFRESSLHRAPIKLGAKSARRNPSVARPPRRSVSPARTPSPGPSRRQRIHDSSPLKQLTTMAVRRSRTPAKSPSPASPRKQLVTMAARKCTPLVRKTGTKKKERKGTGFDSSDDLWEESSASDSDEGSPQEKRKKLKSTVFQKKKTPPQRHPTSSKNYDPNMPMEKRMLWPVPVVTRSQAAKEREERQRNIKQRADKFRRLFRAVYGPMPVDYEMFNLSNPTEPETQCPYCEGRWFKVYLWRPKPEGDYKPALLCWSFPCLAVVDTETTAKLGTMYGAPSKRAILYGPHDAWSYQHSVKMEPEMVTARKVYLLDLDRWRQYPSFRTMIQMANSHAPVVGQDTMAVVRECFPDTDKSRKKTAIYDELRRKIVFCEANGLDQVTYIKGENLVEKEYLEQLKSVRAIQEEAMQKGPKYDIAPGEEDMFKPEFRETLSSFFGGDEKALKNFDARCARIQKLKERQERKEAARARRAEERAKRIADGGEPTDEDTDDEDEEESGEEEENNEQVDEQAEEQEGGRESVDSCVREEINFDAESDLDDGEEQMVEQQAEEHDEEMPVDLGDEEPSLFEEKPLVHSIAGPFHAP